MKTSSKKSSPHKKKSSKHSDNGKFIPNISQLEKVLKDLPDPLHWPEETYKCSVTSGDHEETIAFIRKGFNRSSGKTFRWIFSGKILIRNRDIEAL